MAAVREYDLSIAITSSYFPNMRAVLFCFYEIESPGIYDIGQNHTFVMVWSQRLCLIS